MRVAVYAPDLMDRSRIAAAAERSGTQLVVVSTPHELGEVTGADLAVADLGRPGVVDTARVLSGMATIGFASHVDRDLLRQARQAGWGQVLARSAFFGRLHTLLTGDAG